ncbi:MAG: hypothetical protein RL085_988, partial [Actinomycetota bacterium]
SGVLFSVMDWIADNRIIQEKKVLGKASGVGH